ncbi:MAG: glutamyl-tRNA amidotransferase [Bacteroidetes bacterium GWC2_33_15]|nr:MAG: glutamyl-tRNA amidotransferase [Bacteroidetes bacterium GWA2_33_15]OFX51278.1 MAG: glutamyl-tRNA amidotransferase [Bacteroidetes bacterium GWC2_33_15]OFX66382.1 MAG: glutamyl-tRNA amidotransferase [Bacteroidetes bacterium GWB2_32_14]OFX70681.1 MAG: glutamyl-tRNA amidotransferase [Bacteroidetes bacterium GWD2_33_33]HAN20050.1 glutamyl-tRNA amidotransferase [Bacteroidales bacterium]
MSLTIKIDQDIKTAMLAREKEKLEALRAVKSALLLARTEKGATEEISVDTEIKLLQKLVKQRKDSAAIYQQQNRKDLADKELFEVSIIEKYLPEQMSDEELTEIIKSIIGQTGAKGMADMGKVMGMASKQLAGKAEGKAIADKVKALLNG